MSLSDMDLQSREITLYFKNSFLINGDINNYASFANFRFDNFKIDHIVHGGLSYKTFFEMITPNIIKYILRTSPGTESSIKYTFILQNSRSKGNTWVDNVKDFHPNLVIFLSDTKRLDKKRLVDKINSAIAAQDYTDHDLIHTSDRFNTLTIITTPFTKPITTI